MCIGVGNETRDGNFVLELTAAEVERYKMALADVLTGATREPDMKIFREMSVHLRWATRKQMEKQ
jgi:hypothetical protein